ncbi:HAMP domain-containing histidine kinase [Enterococcus sp. 669A]|uniref:histidine kinase n=1 Tax=Candidatus Enterococcus moelleringii TaxID=2815325 RepID=A0ABS3L565_9ENTE|nr:HAMP domain-containing sensor histidine kinase [Enterococcus sp. 669A]MBO1304747.1 HAMP domain-containing histidine kinase [Enterococcus sp. 669A]
MNWLIPTIIVGSLLLLAFVWSYFHQREKRLMQSLHTMLEEAKKGQLTIHKFEESSYASLENDFYNYLKNSQLSAEQLQEQKQIIQTLISDISHQCVTPIANILLYSQLLEEKQAVPTEEIRLISQQSQKLDFLIQSLVKMSRLESGTIAPVTKQQAVAPLLQALAGQFQSTADAKGIELSITPTAAAAQLDRKWTSEALGNILDNAIKYSPRGSRIDLSAESYQLFTKIEVKDQGIGIAEEEINQIFQRFYRSEAVAEQAGVGVGLYLARQIIEAQGGYIKVTSQVGAGSTFAVYLPNEIYQN